MDIDTILILGLVAVGIFLFTQHASSSTQTTTATTTAMTPAQVFQAVVADTNFWNNLSASGVSTVTINTIKVNLTAIANGTQGNVSQIPTTSVAVAESAISQMVMQSQA